MLNAFQNRTWISGLFCSLALAVARVAEADSESEAERLFIEGRALLQSKEYAEACPRLERSHSLAPATGTLLGLAICNEGAGHYATAWGQYQEVIRRLGREGRPDREHVARERAARIEPLVSTLTFMPSSVALELEGFELWLDGARLQGAAAPIPVEPGTHKVEARAAGRLPQQFTVVLGTATEHRVVAVPELLPSSIPPASPESSPSIDSLSRPDAGPRIFIPTPHSRPVRPGGLAQGALRSHRRALGTTAWVTFGLGLTALTSAGVVGTAAWLKRKDLACADDRCRAEQRGSVRDYMALRTASTVSFVGSAVMLSTSLVLWLTLPKSRAGSSPLGTDVAFAF